MVCSKTGGKGREELGHERLRRRHYLGKTARFATKVVGQAKGAVRGRSARNCEATSKRGVANGVGIDIVAVPGRTDQNRTPIHSCACLPG